MKTFVTRHHLRNGPLYPCVSIVWREDDSWAGGGFEGKLSLWFGESKQDPHEHTVRIGQGCPLGEVNITFDDFGPGAWRFTSFEGVGITERDLQWATLWAVEALRSRRAVGDLPPVPNS